MQSYAAIKILQFSKVLPEKLLLWLESEESQRTLPYASLIASVAGSSSTQGRGTLW